MARGIPASLAFECLQVSSWQDAPHGPTSGVYNGLVESDLDMLSTLKSLFGRKDPKFDEALRRQREHIQKAPKKLRKLLKKDINFLVTIIESFRDEADTEEDETLVTSELGANNPDPRYYTENRLNRLLTVVSNYQHGLKGKANSKWASEAELELIQYLSFSSTEPASFPVHARNVVRDIKKLEEQELETLSGHTVLLNLFTQLLDKIK